MKPGARRWTAQDDALVRALYTVTATRHLAGLLQRAPNSVRDRASRLGLKKGGAFPVWTEAEDALLRARYASAYTADLAREMGRGLAALHKRARRLGLTKTSVYRDDYQTHNTLPLGATSRGGRGYTYVKVRAGGWPEAWRLLHHLVWETHHGPLPDGYRVTFRDGNPDHVDPANLELVAARDWIMRYHPAHTLPPPLVQLIRLKGALTRAINRRTKKEQQHHE